MTAAAVARWRDALEALRIPAPILEAAPESPWGFPAELFRRRAATPDVVTPTTTRAAEVLPAGGSVLDVGCGGGATSLPLAPPAGVLIGVDEQADMLEEFRRAATEAGAEARAVHGRWPDVAPEAGLADVVVCGHVLYNVAEAAPFVPENYLDWSGPYEAPVADPWRPGSRPSSRSSATASSAVGPSGRSIP